MSSKTVELLCQRQNLKTLLQMFAFAAVMPILIKCFSLQRILGMMTPREKAQAQNTSHASVKRIVSLGLLLLNRNRLFLKNSCLKRSLLLYYFLRKDGVNVQIYFGIKKLDDRLSGHSWLTQDGNLLADREQHRRAFTEVLSFPAAKNINHSTWQTQP